MRRLPLAIVLLIASLSACEAQDANEPATSEPTQTGAAITAASSPTPASSGTPQAAAPVTSGIGDSECGADKVRGRWLNALPTADAMAAIAAAAGKRTFRYYTQGDPITMDFSPARLNIEIGADGRIKRFWCG